MAFQTIISTNMIRLRELKSVVNQFFYLILCLKNSKNLTEKTQPRRINFGHDPLKRVTCQFVDSKPTTSCGNKFVIRYSNFWSLLQPFSAEFYCQSKRCDAFNVNCINKHNDFQFEVVK